MNFEEFFTKVFLYNTSKRLALAFEIILQNHNVYQRLQLLLSSWNQLNVGIDQKEDLTEDLTTFMSCGNVLVLISRHAN